MALSYVVHIHSLVLSLRQARGSVLQSIVFGVCRRSHGEAVFRTAPNNALWTNQSSFSFELLLHIWQKTRRGFKILFAKKVTHAVWVRVCIWRSVLHISGMTTYQISQLRQPKAFEEWFVYVRMCLWHSMGKTTFHQKKGVAQGTSSRKVTHPLPTQQTPHLYHNVFMFLARSCECFYSLPRSTYHKKIIHIYTHLHEHIHLHT